MDFSFSEEQQAAQEAAKAAFSGVSLDAVESPALVRAAVADDFDRALWRQLATSDLLGLFVPQEHGGSGLDPVALCLVLREAGRVLARVPLLETSAAALILGAYGSAELRAALLPRIAAGELTLTAAAHGRTGHEPPHHAVTAAREGGGWSLEGTQTAVPWAQTAGLTVIPAHTAQGTPVLAFLPPDAPGVTLAEQASTNGERYAEIRLAAAHIPDRDLIEAPEAADHLHRLLTTGTCALALGLAGRVLEMTSAYVSERRQFGFPVATFQAVAVQTADRYIDVRAMEATLWQAAWRLAPLDVAVAKIWASEGVRRVVQTAQHLHGGMGADTDYPLHRFHAWAKQLELSMGPAAAHEEALGDLLATHQPT
ncbi:acyl-CoA/acyl-ACP dehydrogenase [Streptomyces sp. NBC_01775]|uniref:acyl-CoA dehydrogenase family protein n=1 Tax=Streptomyces sp. NBC_01775 TaxID=2975939 RepID=UPI002DD8CFE6|nr:acyl-CoA dehydrogenase family protein [Streptomyces sp. NBC_01775]WSB77961.1 acyl-CoA/acyl-ACP dehydrogenase [Streptomyces sp. NBC_01775]